MLTSAGLLPLHRARRQMRSSALQVPIFFALNRFGFCLDGGPNLAASVLISKSACVQWQKSRCISVVRLVMAVALEIVWRNPEPPAHSDPKITRSAPSEYSLEGQNFAIVHRAANKICDDYGYMPLAASQDNQELLQEWRPDMLRQ